MAAAISRALLLAVLAVSAHAHGAHEHGVDEHHHHENHHHSHDHHGGPGGDDNGKRVHQEKTEHMHAEPEEWTTSQAWTHALAGVVVVTVGGNAAILLVMRRSVMPQPTLRVMLGFAVGGLLGDVFLHIIPHASSAHEHAHGHETHAHAHDHGNHAHSHEEHSHDLSLGVSMLAGIIVFFVIVIIVFSLPALRQQQQSTSSYNADQSEEHVPQT